MVRNPLSEGKYVTVLMTINTTGTNPAPTTVSGVRQVKRFIRAEHYPSTPGDATREVRVSSTAPIQGNVVDFYSTNLAGTPATVNDTFLVTLEVGG